jgi:hypothetical protein
MIAVPAGDNDHRAKVGVDFLQGRTARALLVYVVTYRDAE